MGLYSDPRHPTITDNPTVHEALMSSRPSDFVRFAAWTSVAWCYGYMVGKNIKRQTAALTMTIGSTAAGIMWLMDTRDRMMGYQKNDREVKMYGTMKDRQFAKIVDLD